MDEEQKDLRTRALEYFFDHINQEYYDAVRKMEHKTRYMTIPFWFEDVFSTLRFDFEEDRFDKITTRVIANRPKPAIGFDGRSEPVFVVCHPSDFKLLDIDIPAQNPKGVR